MELTLPLRGPSGEPVDFRRTLLSHGVAHLPPMEIDEAGASLRVTLPLDHPTYRPRTLVVRERNGVAHVEPVGKPLGRRTATLLLPVLRRILNLDEDLSAFYELVRTDPDLSWAAAGAGRMLRSPTVFEDLVKTICTTNCAWSATVRMVTALVERLGVPARGSGARTFPTALEMARASDGFYRDVVRAGYRGAYLRSLAKDVERGRIDLEELRGPELDDAEVSARLLALPGVGPYAAAHVMMLLGRYSSLVLDSWTRPKYASLVGKKNVADSTIIRRFRRYGRYAGLAYWLFLTRDWVPDPAAEAPFRLSGGEPG